MKRAEAMWTRIFAAFVVAFAMVSSAAPPAAAQVRVSVEDGHLNPMPIAIVEFLGPNPASQQIGRDVVGVIRANLDRSALFRPIQSNAFIERIQALNVPPRFADWKIIDAQALVVGEVTPQADGRIRVDYRVYDVFAEREMVSDTLVTTPDNWRRIAHKISDEIYEQLTGERGYFDTRIVFVSETGPRTRRVKRLMIMDQDGANPFFLTSADAMVLTPRFSPTAQTITYMSFETGAPRVFLYDLGTNRREVLGDFPGMTFSPRFSPNGRGIVFTLDMNGNSEIFAMDLGNRARRRLTNNAAIDTSPSYSPEGNQIVFTSDRGGSPQLYVMNSDGSGQRRISFGSGRYSTPVWSPRGDLIAFTREGGGRFAIGVMRPDGSGERILTESYLDEAPTWSPNGRVIMFFREGRGGGARLWSVDLTGRNLREIPTQTDASDPAWSPLLP
ncbi:MAG TPA: Tol-Pal system beta propeller repeat protein TolB [Vitreimonas sp.]|uniref:Tol-Pal system beta propeller repeat protein TolB n=1 Tax=Vitreimonas sp. TaxID=3069702 RepID=UPI002D4E3615|nr:Tol-Pal system beta propeller repeat protein TolB [Vitreimonas sp.]HYD88195.1 Tol-Pal system beta propeller repeat protein TolB [Vitreimonas sp.]